MANQSIFAWAKWYCKQGYSILPVGDNKKPLIPWARLQKEKTTMQEVEEWWGEKFKGANIGIVTGAINNIMVLDIDTEEGEKAIEEYLPDSLITPIAITPRKGPGKHIYFNYRNGLPNKANIIPGIDLRTDGGFIIAPPSKDHRGKYKWQISISNNPITNIPDILYNLLNTNTTNISYMQYARAHSNNDAILQKGRRDDDLFHLAYCLIKGGCKPETTAQAIEILARSANPPFPEKEIPIKVNSAITRTFTRERKLTDEVREWVLLQEGYFFTTDILQILQITTSKERKHLTVIINRLQKDGIIEKYGSRRGCYRLVQKDEKEMEFIEGEIKEYKINFPLGISDYCILHPKNIVMLAGTKGTGKTAFLMDTILRNFREKEIVYFNSEMGSEEWSLRLKNMGFTKKEQITWKSYQKSQNFHDSITDEDKIFIIDFMEIHDNFYEIAKYIRRIHEKLDKGICIIAVQKKAGAMLGRGAEFSLEKARLYLTLDYNEERRCRTIQIVDVKHPRNSKNEVKGLKRDFHVVEGTRFSPVSDWYISQF